MLLNVLDTLPVGVFILDSRFRVRRVNSKIEEFFAIPRAELLGQDKRRLVREALPGGAPPGARAGGRLYNKLILMKSCLTENTNNS